MNERRSLSLTAKTIILSNLIVFTGMSLLGYMSSVLFVWTLGMSFLMQALLTTGLWYLVGGSSKHISNSLENLRQAAIETMSAGANFSKISADLSSRGESQTAAIQQTNDTLSEIGGMINLSALNAKAAQEESETSANSIAKGQEIVRDLNAAMLEVVQSTRQITSVTQVVDDIAFQISLLSLNASIEAARAGEHGRGFAVVAEAVRNLATRSSKSAKDIADIVATSTQRVTNAQKAAEQNTIILNEIAASIVKMKQLNSEIATSSSEQTLGVENISQAIKQIDSKTQEAAVVSQDAYQQAQELTDQSQKIDTIIAHFETEILGRAG